MSHTVSIFGCSLESIIVLVESDDYSALEMATKETAQKLDELDEYVTSVVAGIDRDFMLENAMMLMGEDEAKMMSFVFADTELQPTALVTSRL